jgi:signal transduction histidine kinase
MQLSHAISDHATFHSLHTLRREVPSFTDQEVAVLAHVNAQVAAGETLADILDFVFGQTRAIMPCDRIGFAFIDAEKARVVAHWARATYDPLLLGQGYAGDLQGSTLEQVMAADTVRIINDLEAYFVDHPDSHSTSLLLQEGVRSSMTCPLSVDGRRVGLLFRSSRSAGAYTQREAALHAAMADRIAQAVEKAWRIEELTRANRSYAEMLRFVSHELKSPIASVIMQTRALCDGLFGGIPANQAEVLEAILERGQHLLDLTNDYLDLARFEGGQVVVHSGEPLDFVQRICQPVAANAAPLLDAHRVTFTSDWPEEPVLAAFDPTLMKIVLSNLLNNAIKYGNTPGRIRLQVKADEEEILVSVWNAGPGFPETMRGHLFQKFSRLHKPELVQRPGTGVGLYIVWQIIRLHGGTVRASSKDGAWAEFSFAIPRRLA